MKIPTLLYYHKYYHNKICLFFIFFISLFLLISLLTSVSATYISLSTELTTETLVQDNETQVKVKLTNIGDETAYDVHISLLFPSEESFQSTFLSPGELVPNSPYKGNITININHPEVVKPGKYSFALLTDYKDANGYGFSSVSPTSLFIKERTLSQVFALMKKVKIPSEGGKEGEPLTLKIRNLDSHPHSLKINLFLPRELKAADTMEKTLDIGPKSEREVTFKISSFGALPGSNYAIFATIEYEDTESGLHYSSIATGVVEIVEKQEVFPSLPNLSTWIPILGFIILIIIFIVYQLKGRE
jgi:hypothetical protein